MHAIVGAAPDPTTKSGGLNSARSSPGRALGATPWAKATKNIKKPPGEKGRTFKKEEMLLGV